MFPGRRYFRRVTFSREVNRKSKFVKTAEKHEGVLIHLNPSRAPDKKG